MIELPEALTLSKEMKEALTGKTVKEVRPPVKPHKFCWFNGDVTDYGRRLIGKTVKDSRAFGLFAEIVLSDNTFIAVKAARVEHDTVFCSDFPPIPRQNSSECVSIPAVFSLSW